MSNNNNNRKNAKFESKGKSMCDYFPSKIIIENIDMRMYSTTRDVLEGLKTLRYGIISNISFLKNYKNTGKTNIQATVEKWNAGLTHNIRALLQQGIPVKTPMHMSDWYFMDVVKQYPDKCTKPKKQVKSDIKQVYMKNGFACDEFGRDIEMRKQYEYIEEVNEDTNSDEKDDYKYNIQVDYGDHPTLFFKINRKTGKREYWGKQTYEYYDVCEEGVSGIV